MLELVLIIEENKRLLNIMKARKQEDLDYLERIKKGYHNAKKKLIEDLKHSLEELEYDYSSSKADTLQSIEKFDGMIDKLEKDIQSLIEVKDSLSSGQTKASRPIEGKEN